MNTTTFILASGDHTRWFGDTCKQLLDINGEPLLQRTLRQFQDAEPYVVSKDPMILALARKPLQIYQSECLCDTVLQTQPHWTDQVTFLLGDVCYTDECAKRIRECNVFPRFFTDGVDIFAFTFLWQQVPHIHIACLKGIQSNYLRKTDGKAWDIYRHFVPEVTHWPIDPASKPPFTEFVGDQTQDFDKVEEHEKFTHGNYKNFVLTGVKT